MDCTYFNVRNTKHRQKKSSDDQPQQQFHQTISGPPKQYIPIVLKATGAAPKAQFKLQTSGEATSSPPVIDTDLKDAFDSGNLLNLQHCLKRKGMYSEVHGKMTIGDLAAENGNFKVLQMLHAMGFNFNNCNKAKLVPIHYAMKKQKLETLRQLVKFGAKPDVQLPAVSGTGLSDTPLHFACATSDTELLKTLLNDCGANLMVRDAQSNSPLHRACLEDSLDAVNTLLPHLTEHLVNLQGQEGKTALHIAVLNQNREIVQHLLQKGALVDIPANRKTVIDILLDLNNNTMLSDFVFYFTVDKMKDVCNEGRTFKTLSNHSLFELYLKFLSAIDNEFSECTMKLMEINASKKEALCTKLKDDDNIDLIEFKQVIVGLLQTGDIHELIQEESSIVLTKITENIVHYVLFKEDAEMLEEIMHCGILWSEVSAKIEANLFKLYNRAPEREINGIQKYIKDRFFDKKEDCLSRDQLCSHYGGQLSCYKLKPYCLENNPNTEYMRHPMDTLPVWSVLSGRLALTELLLRQEKFDIVPLSLFCAALLRTFVKNSDLVVDVEVVEKLAITCETFARKTMEKVHSMDTSYNRSVSVEYLLRTLESYGGVTGLKLAASNECALFLQSELCQTALDKMWFRSLLHLNRYLREFIIWMGVVPFTCVAPMLLIYFKIRHTSATKKCEVKPLISDDQSKQRSTKFRLHDDNVYDAGSGADDKTDLQPFDDPKKRYLNRRRSSAVNQRRHRNPLLLKNDLPLLSNNQNSKTTMCLCTDVLYDFYTTPAVKFRYHIASHIVLVLMMSYFLLIHFTYDICFAEVIVYAILAGLLFEEIGEFVQYLEHNNVRGYTNSMWNAIDIAALACGMVGFVLRITTTNLHTEWVDMQRDFIDESWYAARISLSISCTLYWIRLLYVSTVLENLGPKLKMIAAMITKDLLPFLLILFIVILGFGVLMHNLLYPNGYRAFNTARISNIQVLLGMLKICFYSMVGDYGLDTILGDETCQSIYQNSTENESNCPHQAGRYLVPYLILPLYVIVTEILLLNLIVAMFSKTIETIDATSKDLWQFERYRLIEEFELRSGLPPPLNVIDLLRKLTVLIRNHSPSFYSRCCQSKVQQNSDFNPRQVLHFLLLQALSLRNNRKNLIKSKQETEADKLLSKVREIVQDEVAKVADTNSNRREDTADKSSRILSSRSNYHRFRPGF